MTRTRPRRTGRRSLLQTAVTAACLAGLLGGCELRLETPAPTAPTPGAAEVARQRAAADAQSIAELATAATEGTATAAVDPTAIDTLVEVAATSRRHLVALGGLYVPWAITPSPSPSGSPGPAGPVPTATDVVEALRDAAGRAAAGADTVTDGGLARLLASVSASRAAMGADLAARLAGTPLQLPLTSPASGPGDPATTEEPTPTRTPSATPGTTGSRGHVPGLQDSSLTALIEAHDSLAAGWEVLAARSRGDARTRAALVASGHRAAAQDWAAAIEVDGTALDPRDEAYALPSQVLDPAGDALSALVGLEAQLGDRLADLVARAEPGSRGPFVEALSSTALLTRQAIGTTSAFPGVGDTADADVPAAHAG